MFEALAILWMAMVFGVGIYGGVRLERTKELRSYEPLPIAELVEGHRAKIVGRVELGASTLRAPLSGRECAYYQIAVEAYQEPSNHFSGSWVEVIREVRRVPFAVRDATGVAQIGAADAEVIAENCLAYLRRKVDENDAAELAFLETVGRRDLVGRRSLRYHEGILEAGEEVSVLGQVSRETDPSAPGTGYRELPATRVVMSGRAQEPMLICEVDLED